MCGVEFASVIRDRASILFDNAAKLKVGRVGFNVKWAIMVGVSQKSISGYESFHRAKGVSASRRPVECFGSLEKVCKRRENVTATGPHVAIIRNKAEKTA